MCALLLVRTCDGDPDSFGTPLTSAPSLWLGRRLKLLELHPKGQAVGLGRDDDLVTDLFLRRLLPFFHNSRVLPFLIRQGFGFGGVLFEHFLQGGLGAPAFLGSLLKNPNGKEQRAYVGARRKHEVSLGCLKSNAPEQIQTRTHATKALLDGCAFDAPELLLRGVVCYLA